MIDKEIINHQAQFLIDCLDKNKKFKENIENISLNIFDNEYHVNIKYGDLNKTKCFVQLNDEDKEYDIIISQHEVNQDYWILMGIATILLGHVHTNQLTAVFKHNHHEDQFFKECLLFRDIYLKLKG